MNFNKRGSCDHQLLILGIKKTKKLWNKMKDLKNKFWKLNKNKNQFYLKIFSYKISISI